MILSLPSLSFMSRLIYDNQIYAGRVVTGQALLILEPSDVHTVQEGDTLTSIAQQYGTSVFF